MPRISMKRLQTNKTMSHMTIAVSVATFIVIFCGLSANTLFSQMSYQNRVISADQTAYKQLKTDQSSLNQLVNSYEKFNSSSPNLIGENVTGVDNDNSKIILDALPDVDDAPAETIRLENFFSSLGLPVSNLSIGTNDASSGSGSSTSSTASTATTATVMPSANPTPEPLQVTFTVTGSYQSIQDCISDLKEDIEPIQIQSITITGSSSSSLSMQVSAVTYIQPDKEFTIGTKVIK